MPYSVPIEVFESTYEIKKSLFHARAGFASSRSEAFHLLEQCKLSYPDARHHCWAYLFGDPNAPKSVAMSDDGEPSGTAGKPILNVLQHNDVGDIVMVVSRYFGGTKLGAGGLIRAYSNAALQSLNQLKVKRQVSLVDVHIVTEFQHEQFFRHFVSSHDGLIGSCEYAQGATLKASIPERHLKKLCATGANLHARVERV